MFVNKFYHGVKYCDPAPGAGAAGTAGSAGTQQTGAGTQQPAAGKNNTQDSLTGDEDIGNIWSFGQPAGQTTGQKSDQQNQQTSGNGQQSNQQPNVNNTNANDIFKSHWDSLNVLGNVDLRGLAEQISNNQNPEEALGKAFDSYGQNLYRNAMVAANKIVETKLAAAEERLRQSATGELRTDMAVSRMQEQLKFTADPNIAPVAKAVLNQFLKKGDDLATAIQGVGKYFQSINKHVGKHFGNSQQSGGQRRQQGFVDDSVANDESDVVDWMGLLNS